MKHLIGMNDFLNEGFGFGKNFINKALEFIESVKDLFKGVVIPESDLKDIIDSPSINSAVLFNKSYYNQIKHVCDANEDRIKEEYDRIFGTKEICASSIIISVAVMFAFYYAAQKGWLDKIIRKFDKNYHGYPEAGDDWRKKDTNKKSWKEKIFGGKQPAKKVYKPPMNKEARMDEILDKINKVGYKRLTDEEKSFLKNNR